MIPLDDPIPALMEFVAMWVPDLSAEHRMDANSIPKFLPPPLRSIYELAGNYPVPNTEQWRHPKWTKGLFGPQDQLLPLDQLEVKAERFAFIHENQGVWCCKTSINEDDPPVYSDALAYECGDSEMRQVCSTLSHFVTTFCLQEVFFGSQNLFCVDSEVVAPTDLVSGRIAEIWGDGVYVYGKPTHSFYLSDHGVFLMDMDGSYWLACNGENNERFFNTAHDIRRIR